jgi:hypothetical protein
MQKLSNIYHKSRLGIDNKVWLVMLCTVLAGLGVLSFKVATTERCQTVSLNMKGVMEHDMEHYYFTGENISFTAGMPKSQEIVWDFGDGSPAASGSTVQHSYQNEGNYLVTVTINQRCREAVNVHISQPVLKTLALPSNTGNEERTIIGKDYAQVGELSIYQTETTAEQYEWSIENNAAFGVKTGNKAAFSFTDPGSYTIQLKLNNDPNRVYRKTIIVQAINLKNTAIKPDELPPLPLPAPQDKPGAPSGNLPSESHTENNTATEKKFEVIPDQIFKEIFQEIADGKSEAADVAKYLCDGAGTKVRGNGKTFSNLGLFCEELKGKKGMLGLGGKRKIKSVSAKREIGSNCVYWLDIDYK